MNYINEEFEKALSDFKNAISSQIKTATFDSIQEINNRIISSFFTLESTITTSLNECFSSALEDVMRNFNTAYLSLIKESSKGVVDIFNNENSNSNVSVLDDEITHDYVTIRKTTIKEYKIPDTIAIPIGHNRVKIKTAIFISIIGIIISLIISMSGLIIDRINSASKAQDTSKLLELETEQNKLLQEQNQLLHNFLDSIDTSSSSQAETIEALKSSLQEFDSSFQDKNLNVPDQE